jgi:hypothetical protein
VAESEDEPAPKEHSRIRWTTQWDLPTQEESESPRLMEPEAAPAQELTPTRQVEESAASQLGAETQEPFTPSR